MIPAGVHLDAKSVRPGDKVLVSRQDRRPRRGRAHRPRRPGAEADIPTDSAPLDGLVEHLLAAAPNTRFLRDPTRGGVATVLNELAREAEVAVVIQENAMPVRNMVNGACEILGIDPLYVANEGKLVAVVPAEEAEAALAALRAHPSGATPRSSARCAATRRASSSSTPASGATGSWTCWSATRSRGSAEARTVRC